MMDSLYIAWKYIAANWAKDISLIVILPIASGLLLDESERRLLSHDVNTPLVVGMRGSSLYPGDNLISSPENLLDLADVYP